MFNLKEQQVQNTRDFYRCTSVLSFSSSKKKTIFSGIFRFFAKKANKTRRNQLNSVVVKWYLHKSRIKSDIIEARKRF